MDADKKRAKVVPVDPSKVTDDDGNLIDLTSASKLRRWLIKEYGGREVVVSDNGETVRFVKKELKDSIKRRGKEQRQVYADLDKLLKNSVCQGYEPGDARHPRVEKQGIYYAAAQIGDNLFGIRFKVDIQKSDGSGIYKDHKVAKIEDVEDIDIKKSPSPYPGLSPSGIEGDRIPSPYARLSPAGTEGSQFIPVSKIREVMGLLIK